MEKILLVINAKQPVTRTMDFACGMAKATHSILTGVFIENIFFEYVPAPSSSASLGFSFSKAEQEDVKVTADTEQSIRIFREECEKKKIQSRVYVDKGEPVQEVLFESRFADLIIVDPQINFYDRSEEPPSHFVKELLSKAECPVLIAPDQLQEIEEIIFCYDGSASSSFAVRQFTYLFPEFAHKKVMLLEISSSGKVQFKEGHRRMMDWLRSHYQYASYHSLQGEASDELFFYFFMKKDKLVVMGAYGRSLLSTFFRTSMADRMVRSIDLPIFITHH